MHNKTPKSIVPDGDGTMRVAIKLVFPDARHHLCAWNLHKNCYENVKNKDFSEDFEKKLYANFTQDEFEYFLEGYCCKTWACKQQVGNKNICE